MADKDNDQLIGEMHGRIMVMSGQIETIFKKMNGVADESKKQAVAIEGLRARIKILYAFISTVFLTVIASIIKAFTK